MTWRTGLPSSATHALVGGLIGAAAVSNGGGILWGFHELLGAGHHLAGVAKVVISLLISPAIGFAAAFLLHKLTGLLLRNSKYTVNKWIKRTQWAVAAGLSYSHGANDTQKILGILVLALLSAGIAPMGAAPLWAKLSVGAVMSFGTLLGGWRVMKTVGRGIFEMKPIDSLNSQLASAGAILAANLTGAPVSSTQTVIGSIMGVGSAENHKMVNWNVVKGILVSWVITIPASAAVSALTFLLFKQILRIA
jgi:PiT family inorganic phosphate transporter